MEVLADDGEQDEGIMVSLEDAGIKVHPSIADNNPSIKVLWSNSDSHLSGYEVIKVKSPSIDDEPSLGGHESSLGGHESSLGGHDISEHGDDQILSSSHDLSVDRDLKSEDDSGHEILHTADITESGMLHVAEGDSQILADTTGHISATTNLVTDLTGHSEHDVIQFLLPSSGQEESQDNSGNGLQSIDGINLGSVEDCNQVISSGAQTLQAITLPDGNTAFIHHALGTKLLEGQTITLEDGTTAVIQAVTMPGVNIVGSVGDGNVSEADAGAGTVQLEDTTAGFLNQAVKDQLQAIILEDGTTAYLATQPSNGSMIGDNQAIETSTLTFDQLAAHTSVVPSVLTSAVVNMDTINAADPQVTTVGAFQEAVSNDKAGNVMPGVDADNKVGQLILDRGYRCKFDGCCRYYTTLHHLRVHERSHTGDRPFKCEFERCGKAFATGYGLKSHIRVHTGEKPYKCPQQNCVKAFKTSGDLQKHVRTHTGERPFKCPFVGCDRSFTTSNIRKVHIRTHTGERPYICPEADCGRAFASATNYKNHIRIHTGEKPYVCTVLGCGKRFTEYSSLYKHHVVHTHTKPYSCDRCGKTYRQTSTLAMHKRTAHGEDVTADSEALLFQQQNTDDLEPPDKRARLGFINSDVISEEGEGTLIINTSDQQQFAFVGGDTLTSVSDSLQSPLASSQAILQQGNLAFTLADQSQQVFVITDPAQLEALQQIAKHQVDGTVDHDGTATTLLPMTAGDVATLQPSGITMVTEIGDKLEATDTPGLEHESAIYDPTKQEHDVIHEIGNM